jgi:hypothetical protein
MSTRSFKIRSQVVTIAVAGISIIALWYTHSSRCRIVGDARAAARAQGCILRMVTLIDKSVAYAEYNLKSRTDKDESGSKHSFAEYLMLEGDMCHEDGICCTLVKNCADPFEGWLLSPAFEKKHLFDKDVNPSSPITIVFCHDENHVHQVNSMNFAIIALSDGTVRSYKVDPADYNTWLSDKFRQGKCLLDEFERDVKPDSYTSRSAVR